MCSASTMSTFGLKHNTFSIYCSIFITLSNSYPHCNSMLSRFISFSGLWWVWVGWLWVCINVGTCASIMSFVLLCICFINQTNSQELLITILKWTDLFCCVYWSAVYKKISQNKAYGTGLQKKNFVPHNCVNVFHCLGLKENRVVL
jgi:hypothetical protein